MPRSSGCAGRLHRSVIFSTPPDHSISLNKGIFHPAGTLRRWRCAMAYDDVDDDFEDFPDEPDDDGDGDNW